MIEELKIIADIFGDITGAGVHVVYIYFAFKLVKLMLLIGLGVLSLKTVGNLLTPPSRSE